MWNRFKGLFGERIDECVRSRRWMGMAYYEMCSRKIVMVIWPFHWLVRFIHWGLGRWDNHRMGYRVPLTTIKVTTKGSLRSLWHQKLIGFLADAMDAQPDWAKACLVVSLCIYAAKDFIRLLWF